MIEWRLVLYEALRADGVVEFVRRLFAAFSLIFSVFIRVLGLIKNFLYAKKKYPRVQNDKRQQIKMPTGYKCYINSK